MQAPQSDTQPVDTGPLLAALAEQVPAVIWTVDRELRFTSSFGAGLTGLELQPQQVVGMTLQEYFGSDDPEFEPIRCVRSALAGSATDYELAWEGRFFETHARPLRDDTGAIVGVLGVSMDCTERRGLEDQLRHSQKMEAVGQLAGGVAHDFNNMLTVILGSANLMRVRLTDDDPLQSMVRDIEKAAERAGSLTRELLAFSRHEPRQPAVFEIGALLGGTLSLLRSVVGEQVDLVTELGAKPLCVRADRHELEQVLLNLAGNARDAMPEGGTLTLRADEVTLDAAAVRGHARAAAGTFVRISVVDNGLGMEPQVCRRVFEPFFTTKPDGTGLGLATVYAVAQRNGGFARVASELGKGTTFDVCLPLVEEAAELEESTDGGPAHAPGGSATVLVVEDQSIVRRLVVTVLQEAGYRVLAATHAEDALRFEGEPIDLLLTDVVMPGLSGPDLADRLREDRPGLAVLFMSGYTGAPSVRRKIDASGAPLLRKPFKPHALLEMVESLVR